MARSRRCSVRKRLSRSSPSQNVLPRSNIAKQVSSAQGKYTVYSIITCAIIGTFLSSLLHRVLPALIPTISLEWASELALVIAFAVSAIALVLLLFKMKTIMELVVSSYEDHRLKTFNEQRRINRTDG